MDGVDPSIRDSIDRLPAAVISLTCAYADCSQLVTLCLNAPAPVALCAHPQLLKRLERIQRAIGRNETSAAAAASAAWATKTRTILPVPCFSSPLDSRMDAWLSAPVSSQPTSQRMSQ